MQVLLVEDDPGDAALLRHTLEADVTTRIQLAHETTLAGAATRQEEAPRPDVVLLDLHLPDSTGLDTLHRLLATDARIPIVVLTGADDDRVARQAVDAGAQDYLVKGTVSGPVMVRVLTHAIERHRLVEALRERIKEMTSVFGISQALQERAAPDEVCALVAAHVGAAMQWPAQCHVAVTIDASSATSGPPADSRDVLLSAPITVHGQDRGRIDVGYSDPRLQPLLPEEQQMLDAAADTVAGWLARSDAVGALADEQERLRTLVAELPGLFWTTDADLRVTSHDGALLGEVGITDDSLLGDPIHDLLHPEDADPRAPFEAALSGRTTTFECQFRQRPWRNYVQPMRGPAGRTVGLACLSLDITTERQQASDLDVLRQRAQGLFIHATDAMIMAGDDGTYLDVNPAACELTGYSHDELVGRTAADLAAPEEGLTADDALELWQQFLVRGTMAGEFTIRRQDGSTVVTDFRAVANIVPGVHLSTLRDITDRRAAHDALAASETQFRQLADNATDIVARLRIDGQLDTRLDYVNGAAADILGWSVAQMHADPSILGRTVSDAMVAGLHEQLPDTDRPMTSATVEVGRADGSSVWLESKASLVDASTTPPVVQVIARDVTSRQQAEQALRDALEAERQASERLRTTDELKSSFLRSISHELRTPLTSVLGYAHTLTDHGDRLESDQTTDFTRRLLTNAQRLDVLLNDLLDVDRLSRGTVRLDLRTTDLTALVARVAEEIEFGGRTCVLDGTPATADVDRPKVERIVHNLLANSVKHTPPGTTVWVACAQDDDTATITVSDDGPGIDVANADAVFAPFWQGDVMHDAASPGTGIGLSLVRQLATLHGGSVAVETRDDGGAVFTCHLPRRRGVPAGTEPRGPLVVEAPLGDDHGQTAFEELMRDTIEQLDAVTDSTSAGGVVLAFIQRLGVDLVTVDDPRRDILPIDLSVQDPQTLRAAAPAGSTARRRLENHLPFLLDHARRRVAASGPGPLRPEDLDPVTGVVWPGAVERVLGHVHGHDSVVLLIATSGDGEVLDATHTLEHLSDLSRRVNRSDDHALLISPTELLVVLPDTPQPVAETVLARLQDEWHEGDHGLPPLLGGTSAAVTGGGMQAVEQARRAARRSAHDAIPHTRTRHGGDG